MNPRTTALLAVTLVVLGGVAFLMERRHEASKLPPSDKLFPAFAIDQVDGIEIQKQNTETRLAKRDGTWIVLNEDEKPADPKLVSDILTDVDQLRGTDLVSTNADNHSLYEVGETGVTVRVTEDGDDVASFIVGKPGPDVNSSYIRPLDDDRTYRVSVYLRSKVDRGGQSWRNKTLLDIPPSDVASYRTTDAEGAVRFERDGAGWRSTEPFAGTVEMENVMGMVLTGISKIVATGFADTVDAVTAGLEPPARTLEIRTTDGTSHLIEIGGENEARQTYTRRAGDEQIYLVPLGRWSTIFRKAEEIATPDPNPGTTGEETGAAGGEGPGATDNPTAGREAAATGTPP